MLLIRQQTFSLLFVIIFLGTFDGWVIPYSLPEGCMII